MNALLLDTHALIWCFHSPQRLSLAASRALDDTAAAGGTVYISGISLVEIVYLVEKGRLPDGTLENVQGVIAGGAKLEIVPVDAAVALRIRRVDRSIVPDMPDGIIAATALALNVTRDGRIRTTTLTTIWWTRAAFAAS